ncbi:unnamed protein product [Protopolystoma xenopodis]|uniref:Uncharacterized protein n=1 Tax=Protopolystoma xenopodis TaxID=117903 RepID=A0A448WRA8_9PLAT|nr:unnamed protein product [Protopolystoma xenopodis]
MYHAQGVTGAATRGASGLWSPVPVPPLFWLPPPTGVQHARRLRTRCVLLSRPDNKTKLRERGQPTSGYHCFVQHRQVLIQAIAAALSDPNSSTSSDFYQPSISPPWFDASTPSLGAVEEKIFHFMDWPLLPVPMVPRNFLILHRHEDMTSKVVMSRSGPAEPASITPTRGILEAAKMLVGHERSLPTKKNPRNISETASHGLLVAQENAQL